MGKKSKEKEARKEQKAAEKKLKKLHKLVQHSNTLHNTPEEALSSYARILRKMDKLRGVFDKEELEWLRIVRSDVHYNMACMWSVAGEKAQALFTFERALGFGFNRWDEIAQDPELNSIRGEPAFQAALNRAMPKDRPRVPLSGVMPVAAPAEGAPPS